MGSAEEREAARALRKSTMEQSSREDEELLERLVQKTVNALAGSPARADFDLCEDIDFAADYDIPLAKVESSSEIAECEESIEREVSALKLMVIATVMRVMIHR